MEHRLSVVRVTGIVLLLLAAAVGHAQAQHLKLLAGATVGTLASDYDSGMVFSRLTLGAVAF